MNPAELPATATAPTGSVLRALAIVGALLIAGCATGPRTITSSPQAVSPEESGQYEVVTGREPAIVADLRAAAPPAQPEMSDGKNFAADRQHLAAQSYMHIGTSHFPAADAHAREDALRQGQRVGADRVIVYPSNPDSITVAYYVRFKLPFGATFRDLRPEEANEFGSAGGVAIGAVVSDSPAARANLLSGDIVLKCDGNAIVNRTDFQNRLRARAGHPVTLTIVRNGETLQRMVRLGPLTSGS